MSDVDAVLCGLCTYRRTYDVQILWEAGADPPFATIHLMPPTGEQIAASPWLKECFQKLSEEVNSDATTPEYLRAMTTKGKGRRQRPPSGFQKLTTPAKPPPKKKAQRQLFDVQESEDDSDYSTQEQESDRSDSPPKRHQARGSKDRSVDDRFKKLEARMNNLQDAETLLNHVSWMMSSNGREFVT